VADTAFFTEKELAEMLGKAGQAVNLCNMEFITQAALAVEGFISRLGVNVGEQEITEFLPSVSGQSISTNEVLAEYANQRVSFSELGTGPESSQIIVRRTPLKSVTSIYYNLAAWIAGTPGGDWPVETLMPVGTYVPDWEVSGQCSTGIIRRRVATWPIEPRTLKVTYVGGWTTAELEAKYPELKPALRFGIYQWLARDAVARRMASGLTGSSFSIEDFSVSLNTGQISATTMAGGLPAIVLPPDVTVALAREENFSKYFPI
jgi:hypothetical protein